MNKLIKYKNLFTEPKVIVLYIYSLLLIFNCIFPILPWWFVLIPVEIFAVLMTICYITKEKYEVSVTEEDKSEEEKEEGCD